MRGFVNSLRTRRDSRDREIGISLVEILVYIALFAVLSVMITAVISNTINNTQRITATSTTSASVNTAASNLQRDLSLAQKITYAGKDRIDYEAAINGVGYEISIFQWSPGDSTNGTGSNSLPNVPAIIPTPVDRTIIYQYRKNLVTGATSFTILLDGYNPAGISKPLFVYYDNENGELDVDTQLDKRSSTVTEVEDNQLNRNKIARVEFNVAANVAGRTTPLQVSSSVTPFFNGGTGTYQPPAANDPGSPQCVSTFTANINSTGTALERRTTVLRWNAPYGATSYTIYRYDMGEGTTVEQYADEPIIILDPNTTSLRDDGSAGTWDRAKWGHTYKYTISVAYSYGISSECSTILATIQPEPPTIVNIQPYAYGPTTPDFAQTNINTNPPAALTFASSGTTGSMCGSAGISDTAPTVSMYVPYQGGASLVNGPATVNPMTSRTTPTSATDPCYSDDVRQQNYYYTVARGLVNQLSWSWSKGATEYYVRLAGSNTNLATITLSSLHSGGNVYNFVWRDTAPTRAAYGASTSYVVVANNPGGESLPSNPVTLVSPPLPSTFLKSTETDNPATTVDNPGTPYLIETIEGAPGTDATRPDTGVLSPDGLTKNNIIITDNANTNATAFVVYRNSEISATPNCSALTRTDSLNFTTSMAPRADVLSNNGTPVNFTFQGSTDNVAWGSASCYEIRGWNPAGLSQIDTAKNRVTIKQYPAPYSSSSLPIGQINSGYWLLFDKSPTHLRNSDAGIYCWWGAGGTLGNEPPHYSDPCSNGSGRDGQGFTEPNYYAGVGYVGDGDSASSVGTPSSISYSVATVNGGQRYQMDRCMLATSYGSTQIKYPGQSGSATYSINTNGTTEQPTCIDTAALTGIPFPGSKTSSINHTAPASGTTTCSLSNPSSITPTVLPAGQLCSVKFTLVGEMPGSLFKMLATAYSPTGVPRTLTNASAVITTKASAPMRGESYYTNSNDGYSMNNYASRSVAMGFATSVQMQARIDPWDGSDNSYRPANDPSPLDVVNPGWTKSLSAVATNGQITTGNECGAVPAGSSVDISYHNASGVHTTGSTAYTPYSTGVPEGWPGTVGCQITPCTANGGLPHTMKGIQALWNPRTFFNGLDSQLGINVNNLPTKSNGITIRSAGYIMFGYGSTSRPCGNPVTLTPDPEDWYFQGGHSRYAVVVSNGGVSASTNAEINQWVGFGTQPAPIKDVVASPNQCKYLDEADPDYTQLPNPENGCLYGWGQPQKPLNLIVGERTFDPLTLETEAQIIWDSVPGANSYEISYRHSNASVDTSVIVPATADDTQMHSIYMIGAIHSNVKVRAFNSNYHPSNPDGHGNNPSGSYIDPIAVSADRYLDGSQNPWSDTVTAYGLAITTPDLEYVGQTTTNHTIEWTAVPTATEYRVYRSTDNEANYSLVATISGTTYTGTWTESNRTIYSYYVVAVNGTTVPNLLSDKTETVHVVPRAVITSLTWANDNSATIQWSPAQILPPGTPMQSVNYNVYVQIGEGSWNMVHATASDSVNTLSYTIPGLSRTTNGSVRAYVTADHASTGLRNSETKQLLGTQISPVLSQGTVSGTQISLSWTAPPGAATYRLYQSVNGAAYTQIYSGSATSYNASWTQNLGQQYRFYVVAVSMYNTVSINSNGITVLGTLSTPTISLSYNNTSYTATWTAVSGATTYLLERRITNKNGTVGSWTTVMSGQPATNRSYTGSWTIANGEKYEFRVRAQTAYVNGSFSNVGTITGTVPAPVLSVGSYTNTTTGIQFSWTAVSVATGYDIYISTEGGSYVATALGNVTSYTLNRTLSSTYTVYVRAKNAVINSSASNSNSLTITGTLGTPTLNVSSTSTTQNVSWSSVSGATTYLLERRVTNKNGTVGAWATVSGYPANNTSYATSWTRTNGERYEYRVRAQTSFVNGSFSNVGTITGTVPAPVLSVATYTGGTTSLSFSWPAVSAATGYDVYISTNGGAYASTALGNVTSYTFSRNLANTYTIYVRAKNALINSSASNSNSVAVAAGIPNAPSSVSVASRTMNYTNSSSTGFTLNSNNVTCAFGYPELQFIQTKRNGTAGSWSTSTITPRGTTFSPGSISGTATQSFNSTWGYQGGAQTFQVRARCVGPGGASGWTTSAAYSFTMTIYNPTTAGSLTWSANNYQYTYTAPTTCAVGTTPRVKVAQTGYTTYGGWATGEWVSYGWTGTTGGASSGLLTAPQTLQGHRVQVEYSAYCVGPQASSATDTTGAIKTTAQSPSYRAFNSGVHGYVSYGMWHPNTLDYHLQVSGCPAGSYYYVNDDYFMGAGATYGNYSYYYAHTYTLTGGSTQDIWATHHNNGSWWHQHYFWVRCYTDQGAWTSGHGAYQNTNWYATGRI